ncbi:MAG TPA: hypothetical protein VFL36_17590 [Myxococcales bacterium]|nr:hypothetical protein [Myxococcales bacterium]
MNQGPTRELKLGPDTWFRFAVQIQAWAQAHQDRRTAPGTNDGSYGYDFFCRRCRFFTTGSVVKNVFFNFLFEAGNVGKADPVTGAKNPPTPQVLDAYGQVKFADAFWVSAGSILLPLTRNGTQPTTTYLSLDNANVDTSPILQGNTNVIRDLGVQANGFFLDNHLEYRLGVFQGSRQPANGTAQTAGHNGPRVVASLMLDFWDPEVGYVNGGHYYGTKKVLGLMGNWDYQSFRKDAPGLPAPTAPTANQPAGQDKDAYMGFSAAAFINYPLSGAPSKTGGDEIAATLQVGYYNGGFATNAAGVTTNQGTYPNVLKQMNYLAEAAYYNHAGHFSVFGKYEKRALSDDNILPLRQSAAIGNVTWIAGGLKYYLAPANLMNLALQYERTIVDDAPAAQQGGFNTVTLAWQTILY